MALALLRRPYLPRQGSCRAVGVGTRLWVATTIRTATTGPFGLDSQRRSIRWPQSWLVSRDWVTPQEIVRIPPYRCHHEIAAQGRPALTSKLAERRAVRELTAGRGRGPGRRPTALQSGRCPVPRCRERIDPSRLMCRDHWYLVPKDLRDMLWATWRSGQGALSPEHLHATHLAINTC